MPLGTPCDIRDRIIIYRICCTLRHNGFISYARTTWMMSLTGQNTFSPLFCHTLNFILAKTVNIFTPQLLVYFCYIFFKSDNHINSHNTFFSILISSLSIAGRAGYRRYCVANIESLLIVTQALSEGCCHPSYLAVLLLKSDLPAANIF